MPDYRNSSMSLVGRGRWHRWRRKGVESGVGDGVGGVGNVVGAGDGSVGDVVDAGVSGVGDDVGYEW